MQIRWRHGGHGVWTIAIILVLVVVLALILVSSLSSERGHGHMRVPTHVPTWAYDDWTPVDPCNGGGDGHGPAPAALVDAWVTYAESSCGPQALTSKAIDDCDAGGQHHCTALAYLETNFDYAVNRQPRNDPLRGRCALYVPPSRPRSWWLHATDGQRLVKVLDGTDNYLYNQTTPAVQRFFRHYVATCLSGYGGLMLDDMGTSLAGLLGGVQGSPATTAEIATETALVRAHRALADALASLHGGAGSSELLVDNGLSDNPSVAPPWGLLDHPSAVHGVIAEGDPVAISAAGDQVLAPDATGAPSEAFYATLLDEIAFVDNARSDGLSDRDFVVLLSYGTTANTQARLLAQATEMLGYAGGHLVDWANLETSSSDLAVWPEEGLVPIRPVQTMAPPSGAGCMRGVGVVCTAGGHVDLEVPGSPGVYRREFRACDDRGAPVGACAAIVNDSPSPVRILGRWLHQRYRWEIGLRGGDVESGGRIVLHGARFTPGRSVVPAHGAVLLDALS